MINLNPYSHKIPLQKITFLVILLILIIIRFTQKNDLNRYITIVNYISMFVSFFSIWFKLFSETKNDRNKNICKSIFCIIFIMSVIIGCIIFFMEINISPKSNDIMALFALLFCLSDTVFENIINKIFSLTYI